MSKTGIEGSKLGLNWPQSAGILIRTSTEIVRRDTGGVRYQRLSIENSGGLGSEE